MYKQQCIPPLSVRLFAGGVFSLCLLFLAGCSGVDKASNSLVSALSPYKMEVVQGNFVSKEQAALIQPGMSRNQVRTILGTPLLVDIFHPERWDYVFSINRQGVDPLERRFTVHFSGDTVASVEASGELLSEEEFVRHLDAVVEDDDEVEIPVLQATPEQLEEASKAAQAYRDRMQQMQGEAPDSAARPAGYYPPLDSNY